jgi:hypothetical protein
MEVEDAFASVVIIQYFDIDSRNTVIKI